MLRDQGRPGGDGLQARGVGYVTKRGRRSPKRSFAAVLRTKAMDAKPGARKTMMLDEEEKKSVAYLSSMETERQSSMA
ncbi:hypothetical protein BDP55DRAFT_22761 [Colletotrichum godetiae]|uniref:Uncharacterized protein n=1 Tax=Colletotrichum godetiae TaxID=1209918 RepID=A0AAJ0B1R8_9PEZI|nr:uncharacterized protein BDP55DRAFT_22761 [Colletotrichum godetiae]KAK1701497.1 hypothetical protein BDP55DRAFT_22761 [Colletotrichum godetiae]